MKKSRITKSVWALALACIMITAFAIPAIAATSTVTAELSYRDIKITMNGAAVIPKDADGNTVEPFIIDGTTYLPVRAVSDALGLGVNWDAASSTVQLTGSEAKLPASDMVWITRTGSKYHHDGTCNGGTYWEAPLASAVGMGLEPCDKCVN